MQNNQDFGMSKQYKIIGILTVIMGMITVNTFAQYTSEEDAQIRAATMAKEKQTIAAQQLKYFSGRKTELEKLSKAEIAELSTDHYQLVERLRGNRPSDVEVENRRNHFLEMSKSKLIDTCVDLEKETGIAKMNVK